VDDVGLSPPDEQFIVNLYQSRAIGVR
jgi:hypothetical protein